MTQGTLQTILVLTPLMIGGIIAALNADNVNDTTENIEVWVRKTQSNTSTLKGWFSRFLSNPILWTIVKFCDWTDSFEHRGLKNGVRVASTLYLIAAWCFLLYTAFMIGLIVIISGVIIYVFYKVVFTVLLNSNPKIRAGYELGKSIIGPVGEGKRINQETGIIQEKGVFGWNDTEERIDPETGQVQTKGTFGWNNSETRIDQETGNIQEKGFLGYNDTETRVNPETGIIQQKGVIGWNDTDQRIDPETGRHQTKGVLGWKDE